MRSTKSTALALWTSPVLIGTITVAVLALAVYLSYIAENGLPFVHTYQVNVQVANGDELNKNADVRVGGARVGQILTVTPEPPTATYPHPYAQLQLQLQPGLEPCPPTRATGSGWPRCWAESTSSSCPARATVPECPMAGR